MRIIFSLIFFFVTLQLSFADNNLTLNNNWQENLIPRQLFFGNHPDNKRYARISPDGRYIAYIAPLNGVLNIWLSDSKNLTLAKPITHNTKTDIEFFHWCYTNKHIIYGHDNNGDENTRLYVLNLATGKDKLLTPKNSTQAFIGRMSKKFPHEVLIGLNDRDKKFHDIYLFNINNGKRKLIYKNLEFQQIIYDDCFEPRFASKYDQNGTKQLFYYQNNQFVLYQTADYTSSRTTEILRTVNQDSTDFYMTDNRDSNFSVLRKISFNQLNELGPKAFGKIIFKPKNQQINDIVVSKQTGDIIALQTTYLKSKWHVLDKQFKPMFQDLQNKLNPKFGDVNFSLIDTSSDETKWIIGVGRDTQPLCYYYYNMLDKTLEYLFSTRPEIAKHNEQLSKMYTIEIKSKDGLKLPSYYTLPKNLDNNGRLTKPISFVVLVHGGPHSRDEWGFNPRVQWLANRGYGVLQINFRGSINCGKNIYAKGQGNYGGKAIDDLIDGVKWLINNKFSTKQQIAIMGASYGGYAALAGLTFYPDIFSCGIDMFGRSNLETLVIPEYWKPALGDIKKRIGGDPETPEGRKFLRSRSPLFFADRIKQPLLIMHGANDPRIKQAESDQIVDKMIKSNIPVSYALFPDEGHGFTKPENRIAAYYLIEKLLHKILKGNLEAPDTDLNKSSIIIKYDTCNLLD